MPQHSTFVTDLLRAALPGASSTVQLTRDQAVSLCRLGLGPLARTLHAAGRLSADSDTLELLQGADLTSRLLHGRTSRAVGELLAEFGQRQIRATLLKGISVADQYYDPPWCRIMGDVDLLVARHDLEPAADAMTALGYRPDPAESVEGSHHHLPAMRHPQTGVIIELHSDLFRPGSPPSTCKLLTNDAWRGHLSASRFAGIAVTRFAPEYQLAYTIAHWASDRKWPVNVFAFADAALILAREDAFDWGRFVNWSKTCDWLAAVVTIMLLTLARHDLWRPVEPVAQALSGWRRTGRRRNVDFLLRLVTDIPLSGGLAPRRRLDDAQARMLWRQMLSPGANFLSRNRAVSHLVRTQVRRLLQSFIRFARQTAAGIRTRL